MIVTKKEISDKTECRRVPAVLCFNPYFTYCYISHYGNFAANSDSELTVNGCQTGITVRNKQDFIDKVYKRINRI